MSDNLEVIETAKIYNDPSLPMIVHAIDFIKLWDKIPSPDTFLATKTNKCNFDRLDWLEQFRETERADELTDFMANELKLPIGNKLKELPPSWITGNTANILYDQTLTFGLTMPTRLRESLCGAVYAFPNYYLTYYHLEYIKSKYSKSPETRYRLIKITNLQKCVGLALRDILSRNPKLNLGREVIVNTTDSLSEQATIYCDAGRLYKWVNSGHTLKELCTNWILNKTNPIV